MVNYHAMAILPERLKIGESVISISMKEDVGVYETSDYVLIEISNKAGKINIPKIKTPNTSMQNLFLFICILSLIYNYIYIITKYFNKIKNTLLITTYYIITDK